jgi:hypothetical protein
MTLFTSSPPALLGEEGLKELNYLLRIREPAKIFNRIIFFFIAEPRKIYLLALVLRFKHLITPY